jgi:hypothetical protein
MVYKVFANEIPIGSAFRVNAGFIFPHHFARDEDICHAQLEFVSHTGVRIVAKTDKLIPLSAITQYHSVEDCLVLLPVVSSIGPSVEKHLSVLKEDREGVLHAPGGLGRAIMKPRGQLIQYDCTSLEGDCGSGIWVDGKLVGMHVFGSKTCDNAAIAFDEIMLAYFRDLQKKEANQASGTSVSQRKSKSQTETTERKPASKQPVKGKEPQEASPPL